MHSKTKIILVTGASSGIGKETAQYLIKQGHTVYGAARRVEKMNDLVEAGGHALAMDITKPNQIDAAVTQIMSEQGRVDVLINNAGFGLYGAVEDVTLDQARYQFEVNIFGLAGVTKAVLPHMRENKSGTIINISSMGGKVYFPLGAWYHATKHALEGWSDSLRLEVKQFGIDVVIIEPGAIATEFGDVMEKPLLEASGEGHYKKLAHAMAKLVRQSYEPGASSPPSVISNAIGKAVSAKQPKTRYVAGKMAKPMMFIRKYFGDRFYDRSVLSQIK